MKNKPMALIRLIALNLIDLFFILFYWNYVYHEVLYNIYKKVNTVQLYVWISFLATLFSCMCGSVSFNGTCSENAHTQNMAPPPATTSSQL